MHRPSNSRYSRWVALLMLLIALSASLSYAAPLHSSAFDPERADGVMVEIVNTGQMKAETVETISNTLAAEGLQTQALTGNDHLLVVRNQSGDETNLLADLRTKHPDWIVEPNWQVSIEDLPNDIGLTEQWQIVDPNGSQIYRLWQDPSWSPGTAQIDVVVIDTGAGIHPDLEYFQTLKAATYDSPYDQHGHGTHVAGIIKASTNNQQGVAGIGWRYNIRLISCRALNKDGQGNFADVIDCLDQARNMGVKIANASLSGTDESLLLKQAVDRFEQNGILFAAVGNDGRVNPFTPRYPGLYARFAVGAFDISRQKADFSNKNPDISASGVDVLSTMLLKHNDGTLEPIYQQLSGTSMATPIAAAVAAITWATWPNWVNVQVAARLEETADPIGSEEDFGVGAVNAYLAVTQSITDTAAPLIVSKQPNTTDTNISRSSGITVVFSEQLARPTERMFTVLENGGKSIQGCFAMNPIPRWRPSSLPSNLVKHTP